MNGTPLSNGSRTKPSRIRCAIYTRKSSDEGLEQDFNSLDAQREACTAFIASQKAEGWIALPDRYDDGGLSGGTLERPALQRLLTEVTAGRIDRVVVYKIDRLTRSLGDFAKIVDVLDAGGASFVSVTQSFNTATSMGRLTLNMLLSFAQFEREVTAERIRDKIAASKAKGLWMGGTPPFGYRPKDRSLEIVEDEAVIIRRLFALYTELGSLTTLATRAEALGYRTRALPPGKGRGPGGVPFTANHLHRILTNPVYAGRIRHKDKVYDGQHEAIIAAGDWEAVQVKLQSQSAKGRGSRSTGKGHPLIGRLYGPDGHRLTPTHTKKGDRIYRYFISAHKVTQPDLRDPDHVRLSVPLIETTLREMVGTHLRQVDLAPRIVPDLTAREVGQVQAGLEAMAALCDAGTRGAEWTDLIARARFSIHQVGMTLQRAEIAARLGIDLDRLNKSALGVVAPSRLKRRGHELRLIIGETSANSDPTLAANMLKAQGWYAAIKSGQRIAEIARTEGIGEARIRQLLPLAFLAPGLVKRIADGRQPIWFTTEYVKRNGLPVDWGEQRALLDPEWSKPQDYISSAS